MRYTYNDGGRAAAVCSVDAGDCICRAIATGRHGWLFVFK